MTETADRRGLHRRARFHAMTEGTAEDWSIITDNFLEYAQGLCDRVVAQLEELRADHGGFAIDRLEHSLQTATRAARAGKDDEYVACALVHDIGDIVCTWNHPDAAAAILRPFVSPENHWMVAKHGIFQGYHYFQHIGRDPQLRERYRDHPWFDRTAEFCFEFDQASFDPGYASMTLADFRPLLVDLFSAPRRDVYQETVDDDARRGALTG